MVFCIQILILLISSVIFNYRIQIDFDLSTNPRAGEQQFIIQFLANIILYNTTFGFLYINITWVIVSLLPILIFNNYRKAYSMNLTTFFFPNFFFYVFYWRYSITSFSSVLPTFLVETIALAITILIFSIGLSLIFKLIRNFENDENKVNITEIELKNRSECPQCGTKFDSKPKYCYNCNSHLIEELGE
ncbi:MAG TPA: zinc ribbon domain-containing protein [Candidatus Nanopelagicaceae bacterium]|nr:zinc ribbon domain-containing protein [Candidatus Nanopelagicaceae bacterium]